MGYFNEFPHTRNYDGDLGYLIKMYKKLVALYKSNNEYLDEINQKIEDMTEEQLQEWLEDGTLANIMLQLGAVIRVYPTTTELLTATNLTAGLIVYTGGYSTIGDGGSAFFEIVDSVNSNYYQLKLQENKYANILNTTLTPEMIGCKCDGTTDDTTLFQNLINFVSSKKFDYSIKLLHNIAITNITINDWIKIDFNNVNIVLIGDSGIGVDINPSYNFLLTTQQNIQNGFGNQLFQNISINGNERAGYDYILRVASRDTYFNSIHVYNAYSNGMQVDEYDGMVFPEIMIRGLNTNNSMNLVGLTIDREDTYFEKIEVAYFQTLIDINVTISTPIGFVHVWNDNTYTTKSIGLDITTGAGNSIDNLILDSLTYGFFGNNQYNVGFPMLINHCRMFNTNDGGMLLYNVTSNTTQNMVFNTLTIDGGLSNNEFLGTINNCPLSLIKDSELYTFSNYTTGIYFNKIGNSLKSTYNTRVITTSSAGTTINLGSFTRTIIANKIKPLLCLGTVILTQGTTQYMGVASCEYGTNNIILYFDVSVPANTYNARFDLNIPISTW